ncbi:hypothetical protein PVAG01_03289 [Phlyctema vagabunda]|uniref:Zn(2)-C6 fungal-type domain-containing protein n=1 Tax=Phlyctema vagabunda TaxID=108571 RepID=A0ABR4PKY5_9HELO
MPTSTNFRNGTAVSSPSEDDAQRKVPPPVARFKLRSSCDSCQDVKMKCSQDKPSCRRCLRQGIPCVYSPLRRIGRPRKQTTATCNTKSQSMASSKAAAEPNCADAESMAVDTMVQTSAPTTTDVEVSRLSHSNPATFLGRGETEINVGHDTQPASLEDSEFLVRHANQPESANFETFLDSRNMDETLLADFELCFEGDIPEFSIQELNSVSFTTGNHFKGGGNVFDVDSRHPSLGATTSLGEGTTGMNDFFDQASGTSSMGLPVSQILLTPSDTSSTSSATTNTCKQRCYACLTQQLMYLNEHVPETYHPSIDVFLAVEKETRSIKDKVFGCTACLSNRSTLLILSVIVERVLDMIEKMSHSIHTPGKGRRGNGNSVHTDGSWKRYKFNANVSCPALQTDCVLSIGNFEVEGECKIPFIKVLLQRRLARFGSMLRDLEHAMEAHLKDCNYRAADGIVNDVYKRLESLRGMIELWE